jgi:hypothetical protein
MEYNQALDVAKQYMELLRPVSERIEIVGSVKRNDKPECHDVELLLIPKPGHPRPEFGSKAVYLTHLDQVLARLQATRMLRQPIRKANGEKYKKFAICKYSELNDFCLDLFIVRAETWGIQNVIRTGPRIFSHCFVTNQGMTAFDRETGKSYRGLLPAEYRYIRGETKIVHGEETLVLPEEADAIALLGRGWIEPGIRRKYISQVFSADQTFL